MYAYQYRFDYFKLSKLELHDQNELIKNDLKEERKLIEIKVEDFENKETITDPKDVAGKGKTDKGKAPAKLEKPATQKAADVKGGKDGKKDPKKKKEMKVFDPIKENLKKEMMTLNYGVSNLMLTDLLKDNVKSLKLRGFIAPIQKIEV